MAEQRGIAEQIKGQGTISGDQIRFMQALEANKIREANQNLPEDQQQSLTFEQLSAMGEFEKELGLLGTPAEGELSEAIVDPSMIGDKQALLPSREELAGRLGRQEGQGFFGDTPLGEQLIRSFTETPMEPGAIVERIKQLSQANLESMVPVKQMADKIGQMDIMQSIKQAISETPVGPNGLPDFNVMLQKIDTIQGESEAKKLEQERILKEEFPVAFKEGVETGQDIKDIGIGAAAGVATAGIAPAIAPALGGAKFLPSLGRNVLSGAVGAAATEGSIQTREGLDTKKLLDAAQFGGEVDAALHIFGPLVPPAAKKLMSPVVDKLKKTSAESAFRAIQPIRRTLFRALANKNITPEMLGKVLIEQKIMPAVPFLFRNAGIQERLLKAKDIAGEKLGSLRDAADEKASRIIDILDGNSDNTGLTAQQAIDKRKNMLDVKGAIQVDLRKVSQRLKLALKPVPGGQGETVTEIAKKILADTADGWKNRTTPLTIKEAVELKGTYRLPLAQFGSPSERAKPIAFAWVERILADEIDNAVMTANFISDVLPSRFTKNDIAGRYAEGAREIAKLIKRIEQNGGVEGAPIGATEDLMVKIFEHQTLSELYGSLAKSKDFLFERELAEQSNNMFSLRDNIAMVAGMADGGVSQAVQQTFMSKVLRGRGHASASAAINRLMDVGKLMKVAVGGVTVPASILADTRTVAPAMYWAMTRADSSLYTHGFMNIEDPQFVDEIKTRIKNDDDMSSVKRANLLSEINKTGQLRVFLGGNEKADVENAPSLGGFRDRLADLNVDRIPMPKPIEVKN